MIEQSFQVGPDAALDVRIASGKVEIRAGEPGIVAVRAKGGGAENLTVEQRGSTIWVSSDRRTTWIDRSVYLTIEAPEGLDVDVNVASADIEVDPPVRRLSVNSASGDIRFGNAAELNVKTASGDVHGTTVRGRVNFVSASGDLSVESLGDRAELSTASGDVRIGEASGSIQTSTMSGDVRVGRCTGNEFNAKSMSGLVDVGIPKGTSVDLDATTLSGDISLPEASDSPLTPSTSMNLKVRLVSGDLKVRRV